MKITVTRLKTLLQTTASLSYVKKVEIVSPKLLPDISNTMVPYIGIAPVSSSETWIAQKKQSTMSVEIYAVIFLVQQENAIIGDSVKKGILEIVEDIDVAVRGNFLSSGGVRYLSKPIEIVGIDYVVSGYGDNFYLLVASINLQCVKLFDITLTT